MTIMSSPLPLIRRPGSPPSSPIVAQVWDKDVVGPNESIAEAVLNLGAVFKNAYRSKGRKYELRRQWLTMTHPNRKTVTVSQGHARGMHQTVAVQLLRMVGGAKAVQGCHGCCLGWGREAGRDGRVLKRSQRKEGQCFLARAAPVLSRHPPNRTSFPELVSSRPHSLNIPPSCARLLPALFAGPD